MASHNRYAVNLRVFRAKGMRREGRSAHNVKRRDAENFLRVEDAALLEHFAGDRERAVDGVRDDADVCFRAKLCHALDKVADDGRIGLEEICGCCVRFQSWTSRRVR